MSSWLGLIFPVHTEGVGARQCQSVQLGTRAWPRTVQTEGGLQGPGLWALLTPGGFPVGGRNFLSRSVPLVSQSRLPPAASLAFLHGLFDASHRFLSGPSCPYLGPSEPLQGTVWRIGGFLPLPFLECPGRQSSVGPVTTVTSAALGFPRARLVPSLAFFSSF